MKTLNKIFDEALRRRKRLGSLTNAVRLINGMGDGLQGLLVDQYDRHLHVQILDDHWEKRKESLIELLRARISPVYGIIKSRRGFEIKPEVFMGTNPNTIVQERGLAFEVHLNDGLNCGLFLDMRKNRWHAGQQAHGKKVLNCFAYTCSFGVYARKAGACEVVNVDISRKMLDRGELNYQLNGLTSNPKEFVKMEVVEFLRRALKIGNHFDMIILDPPSFARHQGGVFQVKRDLPQCLALAVGVLKPQGSLLVTTNYSDIGHLDLERMVRAAHNGRGILEIKRVGQDEDFLGSNTFKESYLAGLWVKFL